MVDNYLVVAVTTKLSCSVEFVYDNERVELSIFKLLLLHLLTLLDVFKKGLVLVQLREPV